eukprot:6079733-Prymnesium_polylepis.1
MAYGLCTCRRGAQGSQPRGRGGGRPLTQSSSQIVLTLSHIDAVFRLKFTTRRPGAPDVPDVPRSRRPDVPRCAQTCPDPVRTWYKPRRSRRAQT